MSHPGLAVAAVVGSTAAFGAALAARDQVNPWIATAAVAAAAIAFAAWIHGPSLRDRFAFRAVSALGATALGVALVAATHLGYQLALAILPGLEHEVGALYGVIAAGSPGLATPLLIVVVVAAEELVWRGLAVDLLERRLSRLGVLAGATGLYALPQLIAAAPVLVAAALTIGAVFTAQRLRTGRLTEPLITHAIWSVSLFYALPLV